MTSPWSRIAGLTLATAFVTATTGCSSTPVDQEGRWVGGAEAMTAWVRSQVPNSWDRVEQSVAYLDLIDDFGVDTRRDETMLQAEYRGVSEEEFARFGAGTLQIRGPLSCEPFDPATAAADERPAIKSCYLSLHQGAAPLPEEFDLFAAWTIYPDGTTLTYLYLSNDPR